MHSWIALSRTEHAKCHWQPRQGFEFAAAQQVVPVMLAELSKLLPHYALGFVKDENEAYQAVALIGLGGERNLYITADSQWLCTYVPAVLRAHPFALLRDGARKDSNEQAIFCIDEMSLTADETCPRLFKFDGEMEDRVVEMLNFTTKCEQNRRMTAAASANLAAVEIIESWPISIERSHGEEPITVNGLHRISEAALNALSADQLTDLRNSGALALAYAQLFSMGQLEQLTQRAEYHAKSAKRTIQPAGLGDLFSNDDSGSLNFDAFDAKNYNIEDK